MSGYLKCRNKFTKSSQLLASLNRQQQEVSMKKFRASLVTEDQQNRLGCRELQWTSR